MITTYPKWPAVSIALLFAAQFLVFGLYIPFFPLWLSEQNYTDFEISVLVAVPLMVRVLTVTLTTGVAEGFSDARRPIQIALFMSMALFALFSHLSSFTMLLAVIALASVFWNAILPLCDALAIEITRSSGGSYGRLRLWGSLAFVVANLAGGALIAAHGALVVAPAITLCQGVALAVSFLLPRPDVPQVNRGKGGVALLFVPLATLLKTRGFLAVLIGAALIQASHALLYGYGSIEWRHQGFGDDAIGVLWALGVVAEIALFWVSASIIERFGARAMLVAGGLGAVLRFMILMLAPAYALTLGVQLLHAASFGLTHLGLVAFVARRSGGSETRAAQGLFSMVSGAAMGAATLISAPVYSHFGVHGYGVMAALAGTGLAILIAVRLTVPAAARSG